MTLRKLAQAGQRKYAPSRCEGHDLFDVAREREQASDPVIRRLASRCRITIPMAVLLAELSVWEARAMTDVIRLTYRTPEGDERRLKGRYAWTLAALIRAGAKGVTPIERPAPRWSHYVDVLRDREGLQIETVEERHGGPFKGSHGRYVLRSPVEIIDEVRA